MRPFISSALFISLPIPGGHPLSAAGAGAQGTRPSAAARVSTTQQPADGGWPRAYVTSSGARLVSHEPQIASWLDEKRIAMYAAVSYTAADQSSTALGTIRVEADTRICVPEGRVSFSHLTISSANLPTLLRDQLSNVVSDINAAVPREKRVIGLDRVLTAFDPSQVKPKNIEGLWKRLDGPLPAGFSELPNHDNWTDVKAALGAQHAEDVTAAPTVFVSKKPAELMSLNGVAAYKPVTGTHLEWVSNTDSDVFRLGPTGTVYYLVPGRWYSAPGTTRPARSRYGYSARYNRWTGACTRGGAVYGPYGGAGYAERYNPRTGTYARGAAAWGPCGARGAGQAW